MGLLLTLVAVSMGAEDFKAPTQKAVKDTVLTSDTYSNTKGTYPIIINKGTGAVYYIKNGKRRYDIHKDVKSKIRAKYGLKSKAK